MSEKKWVYSSTISGRRGRSGCYRGKGFPRHTLKGSEDITHLSMRKRYWSKSQPGSVCSGPKPFINSKYIIGLLNKFVGKTYKKFKTIFDQKIKEFKKYNNNGEVYLEDYLDLIKKPDNAYRWHEMFFVSNNGIIKRYPQRRTYRGSIGICKKFVRFNQKVKIPDFGDCTDKEVSEPTLLGEFYLNYKGTIFKAPVYTCKDRVFKEYHFYRENHYDWKLKKNVIVPFEDYYIDHRAARKVSKEWLPVYVIGLEQGQHFYKRLPNSEKALLKTTIDKLVDDLDKATDPKEKDDLKAIINYQKEKFDSMPDTKPYDLGYGSFYCFIKRDDYNKLIPENKKDQNLNN